MQNHMITDTLCNHIQHYLVHLNIQITSTVMINGYSYETFKRSNQISHVKVRLTVNHFNSRNSFKI